MSTEPDDTPEEKAQSPLQEITQPFIDLLHAPRALWGVNAAYFLEGMVYFGMLGYMAMYFHEYVGLDDAWSGYMVGVLTSGITLSMFFLGGLGDKWGIRKALVIAFIFMIIGRAAMSAGPMLGLAPGGLGSPIHIIAMLGVLLVVLGYGMYQPAAYAAVRQFTTPKTSAMAFAMLYALMNLGGWLPSFFSPIRKAIGISGAYGVFTMVSVLALILTAILLTRSVVNRTTEAAKAEKEAGKSDTQKKEEAEKRDLEAAAKQKAKDGGLGEMIWHWLSHHPLADPKFAFFIFALIPVQTLFAHNWLTLPVYVARAYRPPVHVERCETKKADPKAIQALAAAKELGTIQGLKKVTTAFRGTRQACEAKVEIRAIAHIKPTKAKKLTSKETKRIEKARQTIRTLDYEAAVAKAKISGNFSERLRLWLGENFEFAVNFNPLLIFILVPIVTALTQKRKVYNMMIVGTFVMAVPTFFLALGATFWTLLAFLLLMTVGEAMWQPRFLQYAAEIAPEGRTAAYMGVAQFPWFLTKMIVPLYSGYFLSKYVPDDGPVHSEKMWLIYGIIAVSSSVFLVLAKGWVGKDFKTSADS